jgi:hypothetical protein
MSNSIAGSELKTFTNIEKPDEPQKTINFGNTLEVPKNTGNRKMSS